MRQMTDKTATRRPRAAAFLLGVGLMAAAGHNAAQMASPPPLNRAQMNQVNQHVGGAAARAAHNQVSTAVKAATDKPPKSADELQGDDIRDILHSETPASADDAQAESGLCGFLPFLC